MDDWKLFCKAKSHDDSSCSDQALMSPLFYLDNLGNWTDFSQEQLDKAWKQFKDGPYWNTFKFYYNKEKDIDATGEVHYMRSLINFGAPLDMTSKENKNDSSLPGIVYNDITDNEREQKAYMSDFQ